MRCIERANRQPLEDSDVGGLAGFLLIGYLLHRSRGHWAEIVTFSAGPSVLRWAIRVAWGILLSLVGVLLLAFLVTS